MTKAMSADIEAAKTADDAPRYEPVEFRGTEYALTRKPNTLLLAELARTQSGDPEALGTLADFFESTMGRDTYRSFKREVFSTDDVEPEELYALMGEIVEHTLGRPTE